MTTTHSLMHRMTQWQGRTSTSQHAESNYSKREGNSMPSQPAESCQTRHFWLKECADHLADVFNKTFNISLSRNVIPTCFKMTTIIFAAKKSSVSGFNDYHTIAITPITSKCFKKLIMKHIKSLLLPMMDRHEFAYRPNCRTDDAVGGYLVLQMTSSHLDRKNTHIRMLFVDFIAQCLTPSFFSSRLET